MFFRSVNTVCLSKCSCFWEASTRSWWTSQVVLLFLKVATGFLRRPWKSKGLAYSSWDVFILGWFLFKGFWYWHKLHDFPELKNLFYTLDFKYMWYLPPHQQEWSGVFGILFERQQILEKKWVNAKPSIGKSRKHPWLSQNVLAFRLLNWIMFIIVIFCVCVWDSKQEVVCVLFFSKQIKYEKMRALEWKASFPEAAPVWHIALPTPSFSCPQAGPLQSDSLMGFLCPQFNC